MVPASGRVVLKIVCINLPTTLASPVLLCFLGIIVNMTGLCKVTREIFGSFGSAIRKAGMVSVVVFLCLSHCYDRGMSAHGWEVGRRQVR